MLATPKGAWKKALRQAWCFERNPQTVLVRGTRDFDEGSVPYSRRSDTGFEEEVIGREITG